MFLIVLLVQLAYVSALNFTGDAEVDFPVSQSNVTSTANFSAGEYPIYVLYDGIDVTAPAMWPYVVAGSLSGWDMKDIRIQYNYKADTLNMAINCYGICGDADNNGDPASTSMILAARGGQDNANFNSSESCAIALDFGSAATGSTTPDGVFDFIIGYPNTQPSDSDRYPNNTNAYPMGSACATAFDTSCFGLYLADQTNPMDNLGARFLYKASNRALSLASSMNLAVDHNAPTSIMHPDLEWSLSKTNSIRSSAGFGAVDQAGVVPFEIGFAVFCGSFQDDGIGEDYFPNTGDIAILEFPCQVYDACDVCGGDGSACVDCAGIINGPNVLDACNVCGGNGSTCRDCRGHSPATVRYDACDVCGGNGSTCLDCYGVPNGSHQYDVCDVCGGDGTSCRDCKGVVNGSTGYDACDICGGSTANCHSCKGPVIYNCVLFNMTTLTTTTTTTARTTITTTSTATTASSATSVTATVTSLSSSSAAAAAAAATTSTATSANPIGGSSSSSNVVATTTAVGATTTVSAIATASTSAGSGGSSGGGASTTTTSSPPVVALTMSSQTQIVLSSATSLACSVAAILVSLFLMPEFLA